ncbi:MAG: cytosolic protein [Caulobacteraceae bacterium]|nr:cytosolic protein [Caulobacteraceae bacterium]
MSLSDDLEAFRHAERLGEEFIDQFDRLHRPFIEAVKSEASGRTSPLVVGVCGPQGSGKSTLAGVAALMLRAAGLRVAALSLDDLYLSRAERTRLAAEIHPLFATRGPPGTHDPQLGLETLDALSVPGETRLPRFDKAADDCRPRDAWEVFHGPADVVLLEGWCLGVRPQPDNRLAPPINALEREEDADGIWRRHVNAALAGHYQALFGRLDRLALLVAPSFETVLAWRGEQEAKLRQSLADPARTMDQAGLARFIQHYERLTRWAAEDLPARADWVVRLDEARRGTWPA